jgi:hypothetical protein
MYHVSICMYLGKYWQVFLSRYVEIDHFVFHKNTYAILTTRFTDVARPGQADVPMRTACSDWTRNESRHPREGLTPARVCMQCGWRAGRLRQHLGPPSVQWRRPLHEQQAARRGPATRASPNRRNRRLARLEKPHMVYRKQ